jgi:hypothetical protein
MEHTQNGEIKSQSWSTNMVHLVRERGVLEITREAMTSPREQNGLTLTDNMENVLGAKRNA